MKIDGTYNDISLDFGKTGSGTAKIALNTTNLKLGLKTGGRIYFRLEVGYEWVLYLKQSPLRQQITLTLIYRDYNGRYSRNTRNI